MGIRADEIISEGVVELNFEQNYVRVSTPGRRGASPGLMIHDYNLVIKLITLSSGMMRWGQRKCLGKLKHIAYLDLLQNQTLYLKHFRA